MGLGGQMVAVAIGWQVYEIDRDPLDLGLIGLAEFLPLPLLALPAGHLADRLPRRLVFAASLALLMVVTALLVVVTLAGASELWPFLALAFALGVASALRTPAARALPPTLVPTEILAAALALRSTVIQGAVVAGPAVGGILFALRPELVYGASVALFGVALVCVAAVREPVRGISDAAGRGLESVLQGIAFIRRTPVLLGAISLDLVAVLLGGAVALLPLFARDVLEVGPEGLGLLRSAPAVGALAAGILITRRPLRKHVGRRLLVAVGVFGASHGRIRAVALVRAVRRCAGRRRVRRHGQHEHQAHDRRDGHAGGAARPRERGGDGLRQRVERAGRLRVGRGRRADRRRSSGGDRRRAHRRSGARVAVAVP
jgi:MFS family permease